MKQGIHNISAEDYHNDPCPDPSLSRSTAKELLYGSPAHVYHGNKRLNPDFVDKPSESKFDIGTACHSLLLEGDDVAVVCDFKDWKTKIAKEARDEARLAGKLPLLPRQHEKVALMAKAAREQIYGCKELKVKDLYSDGDAELTFIWQEEVPGAGKDTWCRVRPDWTRKNHEVIIDYKTTGESASPDSFARKVISMGYDIQAAMYSRGVKAVTGIMPKFYFVVQEDKAPYLCSFIGLPPDFLAMGVQKFEYGKFLWEQCLRSGEWPGYPNEICWLEMPAWGATQWEEKAAQIGV